MVLNMRTVKVRQLYGIDETSAPWENHSLDEFVFMAPALGSALTIYKFMPSLVTINNFFSQSESDAGMGGGVEWKPFELDQAEYDELLECLCSDPERNIEIDEALNCFTNFEQWQMKAMYKRSMLNQMKK